MVELLPPKLYAFIFICLNIALVIFMTGFQLVITCESVQAHGMGPRENYLLVAAIDFGTAYSGYAFSRVDDFKKDPLKVCRG